MTPTPNRMMYVDVLRSKRDGNLSVGSTRDLRRRLQQHNGGGVSSTKGRIPCDLVSDEASRSEQDARHRESNLKLRSRAFAQLRGRIEGRVQFGVGV